MTFRLPGFESDVTDRPDPTTEHGRGTIDAVVLARRTANTDHVVYGSIETSNP